MPKTRRLSRRKDSSPSENRFEQFFAKHGRTFGKINGFFRTISTVIIILIVLELISFGIVKSYEVASQKDIDFRINSDAFEDKKEAIAYFQEWQGSYRAEYYPYIGYRRKPSFQGKYINLDEQGRRLTIPDCSALSDTPLTIHLYGGSTAWGTGSADNATIASYIARDLCGRQIPVKVTNFGESGFTQTQGVVRFILELQKGNIPDIAIFYDGVNDVFASMQSGIAGFPQNVQNRRDDFNARTEFKWQNGLKHLNIVIGKVLRSIVQPPVKDLELSSDLVEQTASIYAENVKLVKALENDYGFTAYFFWQPSVYTKEQLSEYESSGFPRDAKYDDFYNQMTQILSRNDDIIDLTNIFNNYDETIFIDLPIQRIKEIR